MSSGASRLLQNSVFLTVALTLGLLVIAGCQSDEERLETFIERGDQYVEDKAYAEAIIEFKNVLQIDPENAAAHQALSLAYLQVDKPREAYWEMSETVRLDPENTDARLRYGTLSAAIGDFDLSLEQADAVLDLDPTNSAAFVLRGQSRESKKDLEGAEADFRAAIEGDPQGAAFRFILAGFFERQGRIDEAEQTIRELIQVEESYLAVSSLARIVTELRTRDDEALALLDRAVELAKQVPAKNNPVPDENTHRTSTSLVSNVLRERAVQAAYILLSAFHYDRHRFEKSIDVLEEGVAESETKVELIYQMGRLYRIKGMTEQADAMIRRATEEAPDNVAAKLVLSAYLGRHDDLVGALEAARAAVAIEPKNRSAQLREAELLIDIGYRESDKESIQAGRAIIDAVIGEEPESPEAHFVRAKIELAEGDVEAAKGSLEKVLEARPDWAQARFVLGSALAASKDLRRARVELARAIENEPQLFAARKLLASVHSQLGEDEFAIEQGRAFLKQAPDDSEVRIIVAQSLIRVGRTKEAYEEVVQIPEEDRDAAAYFALGRLDLAFGRNKLGTERLRKADELAPGNPQVLRTLLAVDNANGELAASAARIARAIAANPENSEIFEVDGEAKLAVGDRQGARLALEHAIELDPRNVTAQLALADLETREGNIDTMISIIESAAGAVPESSDLQYRLALAYESKGRNEQAIDAYEKSISLNADLAVAKNNLAYLLAESGGDLDRALELAQQAKEALPDDGSAADTLGWVLLRRGVPSAAIGYLQEAVERFPADASEVQGIVRNHLAEAYERNKDVEKAISESRKSVDYSQKLAKAAKERGVDYAEPDWSREANARIERLASTS